MYICHYAKVSFVAVLGESMVTDAVKVDATRQTLGIQIIVEHDLGHHTRTADATEEEGTALPLAASSLPELLDEGVPGAPSNT
jgi:hypothetical protein